MTEFHYLYFNISLPQIQDKNLSETGYKSSILTNSGIYVMLLITKKGGVSDEPPV